MTDGHDYDKCPRCKAEWLWRAEVKRLKRQAGRTSEKQYRADDVRAHEDFGTALTFDGSCPAHGFYPWAECPECEAVSDERRGK
jgi:hypothetical protein